PSEHASLSRGARGHAGQPGIPGHTGTMQVGERHPARIAYAGISTGQRDIAQVGRTLIAGIVSEEDLAAPYRMVVSVTGAIERDSDHPRATVMTVLRHSGSHMRVVMLNGPHRQPGRIPPGPGRAAISRMPVGDDHLGPGRRNRLEVAPRLVERLESREVVHVADVGGQPDIPVGPNRERVLQIAAYRKGRHDL